MEQRDTHPAGRKTRSGLEYVHTLEERVRKLERLVQLISRAKYMWESTFDAITIPVQVVSGDYRILRANTSLAHIGKHDIIDVAGRKCFEAFAGRTAPCPGCPLQQALDQGDPATAPLQERVHGREFSATAHPYDGGGDDEKLAILSYRDVTEERRLQQEVIQQEKMAAIGMLAGGVAHEINNPLGGIIAFTQLLLRRPAEQEEDPSLKSDLQEIEQAALRCKRIVADLLDFSRVSRERDRRLVDLKVLLEKIFPFIQREMRSLNVEFELQGAAEVPPVFGQADRLQQVFLNLMTNACHAMPKGGKLTIALHKDKGGGARIVVADTGVGIGKENLARIFDPFFTTKHPGSGTGLGLSISYRIVHEHDGSIHVESEEGRGTTFTIVFPPAPQVS